MTPAERLRAAAKVIRDTAAEATPGRWNADGPAVDGDAPRSAFPYKLLIAVTVSTETDVPHEANAAWIALLGPDKAEPIAAWLMHDAEDYERACAIDPSGEPFILPALARPLAFADSILGGGS